MYTAPPSGDEENRDVRPNATEDEAETDESEIDEETTERPTPTVESTPATTDANWTGTVPADD